MRNRDERIELAKKWNKALEKLYKEGMFILLRTAGRWDGIGIDIERRLVDGDMRSILTVVRRDGSVSNEPLDYKPDPRSDPVDCRAFRIDGPFIITMRKSPSFDDDEDSFEPVVMGLQAEHYFRLRDNLERYRREVQMLEYELEEARRIMERQRREIEMLGEHNRMLQEEVNAISAENIHLHETLASIESLLKKYMATATMDSAAIEQILRLVRAAGVERVMGVRERLLDTIKRDKEVLEEMFSIYGEPGEIREEVVSAIRFLRDKVAKMERMLEEMGVSVREEEGERREKKKKEEAVEIED